MFGDLLVGELTIRFINDAAIVNNMFQTETQTNINIAFIYHKIKGWHQLLFDYRKNV
jgi:hypothetical protein